MSDRRGDSPTKVHSHLNSVCEVSGVYSLFFQCCPADFSSNASFREYP